MMFRPLSHVYLSFVLFCFTYTATRGQNAVFEQVFSARLSTVATGQTLTIPPGVSPFKQGVWIDGAKGITITGAGMGSSILDFSALQSGGQAWQFSTCSHVILEGLTIRNAPADGLRLQNCENITLRDVRIEWADRTTSGSYGVFAINSKGVVVEGCEASGAAHSGFVAVRCENVIFSNSKAMKSVIGIAIENAIRVRIQGCTLENNSIGIALVHLPMPAPCQNIAIMGNTIRKNNFRNFSPESDFANGYGDGIGVLCISADSVIISQNTIEGHNTAGIFFASHPSLARMGLKTSDKTMTSRLFCVDNGYDRNGKNPDGQGAMGIFLKSHDAAGDIVYDSTSPTMCIRESPTCVFSALSMQQPGIFLSHDMASFVCAPMPVNNIIKQ